MSLTPRQRRIGLGAAFVVVLLAALRSEPARDVVQPMPERAHAAVVAEPEPSVAAPAPPRADADLEHALRRLQPGPRTAEIRDVFEPRSWTRPQAEPVKAEPAPVRSAPVPPQLPYTYMGQLSEDGRTFVYLMRAEGPVVARAGEVLDGTYRLERISDSAIEFTYLPLSARQVLTVGAMQ